MPALAFAPRAATNQDTRKNAPMGRHEEKEPEREREREQDGGGAECDSRSPRKSQRDTRAIEVPLPLRLTWCHVSISDRVKVSHNIIKPKVSFTNNTAELHF